MKTVLHYITTYIRQTDRWLIGFSLTASGLSCLLLAGIYNSGLVSSSRTVLVQAIAVALGIVAMLILSKFDYHFLARLWKLHVPLAYLLVLLTFVFGTQRSETIDDKAWLVIGGISMQPSEFLKISFILSFAYHLDKVAEDLDQPRALIGLLLHAAAPVALIHFQGDDGTAMIFLLIALIMLFAAGISWRYIAMAAGAAAVALPLVWFFVLDDDKKMRFLALLLPEQFADTQGNAYQQYNALISIGSGGASGIGIFNGAHRYVPEIQNDFIFTFIGEALGFVGTIGVLALLGSICFRVLSDSRRARDTLGSNICVGVFAMLSMQVLVNIGMNLSLFPVVGITLPFFSAGGTSVLSTYLAIGLVLSVYMQNDRGLFIDSPQL